VKLSYKKGVKRGFYRACEKIGAEQRFVVHGGPESIKIGGGELDSFCLSDAIEKVRSAGG